MSNSLGNIAITAAKTTFSAPNDGVKSIVIGNESGYTVTITMESGGVQKTLYPSTVDWFTVRPGFSGTILINPIAILNNVATFPSSSLIFDAIGLNDSEQADMYPISLNRNTNVGNQVSTVGGSSTNIQNDNNPSGTSIVEATVSGDGSSAVSILNQGKITLGTVNNAGELIVIPSTGTTEEVHIDQLGKLTVNNQILANLIQTVTGNDFTTNVETNHKHAFQINSSDVMDLDANGLTILAGHLLLKGASIGSQAGSSSGTATVYQPFQGTELNIVVVVFANYNDNASHNIGLKANFASGGMVLAGGNAPCAPLSSGSPQVVRFQTGFPAAGAGGSQTASTNGVIHNWSFGQVIGAWDTIQLQSTSAAAFNGIVAIIGN